MASLDDHWALVPDACADGCKLADAQRLLTQAAKLAGRTSEGEIMSQALWCDQGGHAFSARDPQAEHWERNATDPQTGKKVMVPWDVCGEHMKAINGRMAAIEADIKAHPAPADE